MDINSKLFEPLKLFGIPVLFTDDHIDKNILPKSIYRYEIRHDDEGKGEMCEIAHRVIVNFWGTILSNRKINLSPNGYREIDENKDVEYSQESKNITMKDYIDRNKQQKHKQKER